jgi:hypothetical protein
MNREWLTRQEAQALVAQYQYLKGQTYLNDGSAEMIESVELAPHDEMSRSFFLSHYLETRKTNNALLFYSQPYYDAVLILKRSSVNGGSYYYLKSVLSFLKIKNNYSGKIDSYSKLYISQ